MSLTFYLLVHFGQLNFISHKMLNELVELIENKNKEVEYMLEQIENSLIRLEFAADEVACKLKSD